MESINVIIDCFSAIRVVDLDDCNIFKNQGSIEGITSDNELSIGVVYIEPSKTTEYQEKELHLPKWVKGDHSTNNIIGDDEEGVITRHQIQDNLN